MNSIFTVVGGITFVLGVYAALAALGGFIFELLWNWVIVGVFHAPILSFWQSVGIVIFLSVVGSFFKSSK